MKATLLSKIDNRSLKVGIVGLGYVGLPLAVEKAKAGYETIGFDIQQSKVDQLNQGINYIGDVVGKDLQELVNSGALRATNNFEFIADVDFVAICVPTPLDKHRQPDTSYIENSARNIAKYLKAGSIVVLESTTYPGTTEDLLKPILERESGLVCGESFYLGFSPERVDPGNLLYNTKNTPKVVSAIGQDALEVIAHLYKQVLSGDVATVSSPAVAEMEKILENAYRNVNIGLVNELSILCHRMGISIWEVIEAAKTKPYGFQAFYPGPGVGGHCIPLDPYYLTWKAREYNFHTTMIESAMIINDGMAEYCVERAGNILNHQGKALSQSRILMLGIAYKQDIADYRESPALNVLRNLLDKKASVDYYDPFIPSFKLDDIVRYSLPQLTGDVLQEYDLVMITTAHTSIDYPFIAQFSKSIFDTKNAMKHIAVRDNIEIL